MFLNLFIWSNRKRKRLLFKEFFSNAKVKMLPYYDLMLQTQAITYPQKFRSEIGIHRSCLRPCTDT